MPRQLMALLILVATGAFAHTHLVRSDPTDDATLAVAPATVTLVFAEPVTLTAVKVESDGAKPVVRLAVSPLPPNPGAQATLPLPPLAAGRYTLGWRALSDDGHIMSGAIHFTIAAAHP
jgi:methionine-rich copper-binding protein CopC